MERVVKKNVNFQTLIGDIQHLFFKIIEGFYTLFKRFLIPASFALQYIADKAIASKPKCAPGIIFRCKNSIFRI